MKIAIIGGHLSPALSVIEELGKDAKILYIGRKYAIEGDKAVSLEYETITKKNIPFAIIKTGRLQRSLTTRTIPSLIKIPFGTFQAVLILKRFKPVVVVGFGSYVSFPVSIAAKILRIPIIIHEQTQEAGFANKIISKFADKVCISFDTSYKFFPRGKTIFTGNPIRKTIFHPTKKFDLLAKDPVIYITGGSLGSHVINLLVAGCLAKLLDKYQIVHQVGDSSEFADFKKLSILKEGLNNNKRGKYTLLKFIPADEIGSLIEISSLVVGRAGINTVSELVALQKPSYLIPLPTTQRNEQMKNAIFLKKIGLGEIGDQKSLTPGSFYEEIEAMMGSLGKYKIKDSQNPIPKNAAWKIVEVIYATGKNSN